MSNYCAPGFVLCTLYLFSLAFIDVGTTLFFYYMKETEKQKDYIIT